MQYKILRTRTTTVHLEETIIEFEKLVNEEIEKGWRPQGGFNFNSIELRASRLFFITQAMVKED